MWQGLPSRHRWLLIGLLVLMLLVLLLKGCIGKPSPSVQAPPLPQQPAAATATGADAAPVTLGTDLRLAERRPVLTSPGLEFVDHGATKPQRSTPAAEQHNQAVTTTAPATTPKAKPKPAAVASAPVTKSASPVVNKKGLFATLPDDAWLLQVAAAPNAAEAQARCQALSLPCVSYAASRQGRQVWILVVGPYASREAALAAVARLPERLRAQGPFARQVKDVRQDAGG